MIALPSIASAEQIRLARFAAVGASGFVVNTLVLALSTEQADLHYTVGAAAATLASTTTNFVLTESLVFGDRTRNGSGLSRFVPFLALSLITLALRGPILVGLTEYAGVHYLASNAISLIALMFVRFRYSGSRIWPESTP